MKNQENPITPPNSRFKARILDSAYKDWQSMQSQAPQSERQISILL
jgi:hypothetical protein